jgi:hypothetical protein
VKPNALTALPAAAGALVLGLMGAAAASAASADPRYSCDDQGRCHDNITGVDYLPYAMGSTDACQDRFGPAYEARRSGADGIICFYHGEANPWLTFDWNLACGQQWPGQYPVRAQAQGVDYVACL